MKKNSWKAILIVLAAAVILAAAVAIAAGGIVPAALCSGGEEREPVSYSDIAGAVTTNGGQEIMLNTLAHLTEDESAPVVYYTKDISPEALVKMYELLPDLPEGKIAVKISTGESEKSNHLRPEFIKDLVDEADGTIIECVTAYGGNRATVAKAKQVAIDRGYTAIAPFDLMDEEGELDIPVKNGERLERAIVGSHITDYSGIIVLSHFKGHAMAGFGGGIKNVGIGMSSAHGKVNVHTAGTRTEGTIVYTDQDAWLEAMAEDVKAVSDFEKENGADMIYISVMNRLSVDCDCDGNPADPDMHDIGVLASTDPVALDQACVDLVYAVSDGQKLIKRMESKHGEHTLEHAEKIGLGSRKYRLENIDG